MKLFDFRERVIHYDSFGYGLFTGIAIGLTLAFIDSVQWWQGTVIMLLLFLGKWFHERCDLSARVKSPTCSRENQNPAL